MNVFARKLLSVTMSGSIAALGFAAIQSGQAAFAEDNKAASSAIASEATADEAAAVPLTKSQIKQHLREINEKYEVGEEFSAEDAEFVKTYASSNSQSDIMLADESSFNKTKTLAKTTVRAKGSIYHNGTISYSYGGTVKVTKISGKTPQKIKVIIHCTSYGAVGTGGVGKIYDKKISASKENADSFTANLRDSYAGLSVAHDIDCSVKVRTAAGDLLTISADD